MTNTESDDHEVESKRLFSGEKRFNFVNAKEIADLENDNEKRTAATLKIFDVLAAEVQKKIDLDIAIEKFTQFQRNISSQLECIQEFHKQYDKELSPIQKRRVKKMEDGWRLENKVTIELLESSNRKHSRSKNEFDQLTKELAVSLRPAGILTYDEQDSWCAYQLWKGHIHKSKKFAGISNSMDSLKRYNHIYKVEISYARILLLQDYISLEYKEKINQPLSQSSKIDLQPLILKKIKNCVAHQSWQQQGKTWGFFGISEKIPTGIATIKQLFEQKAVSLGEIVKEIKISFKSSTRGFCRSSQTQAFYELVLALDIFVHKTKNIDAKTFSDTLESVFGTFSQKWNLSLNSHAEGSKEGNLSIVSK